MQFRNLRSITFPATFSRDHFFSLQHYFTRLIMGLVFKFIFRNVECIFACACLWELLVSFCLPRMFSFLQMKNKNLCKMRFTDSDCSSSSLVMLTSHCFPFRRSVVSAKKSCLLFKDVASLPGMAVFCNLSTTACWCTIDSTDGNSFSSVNKTHLTAAAAAAATMSTMAAVAVAVAATFGRYLVFPRSVGKKKVSLHSLQNIHRHSELDSLMK